MGEVYNRKELKEFRKKLRNNPTKAESIFWKYTRMKNLGVKIRRQHSIGNYIVDFYCPALKLVIEIDGDSHYNEKGKVYDEYRNKYLNNLGIEVVRFSNKDIYENIEGVMWEMTEVIKRKKQTPPNLPLR